MCIALYVTRCQQWPSTHQKTNHIYSNFHAFVARNPFTSVNCVTTSNVHHQLKQRQLTTTAKKLKQHRVSALLLLKRIQKRKTIFATSMTTPIIIRQYSIMYHPGISVCYSPQTLMFHPLHQLTLINVRLITTRETVLSVAVFQMINQLC